jgi:hypothetical protein
MTPTNLLSIVPISVPSRSTIEKSHAPPVLRPDLTEALTEGTDEIESDLAEDVQLDDLTHPPAVTVIDREPGLEQLCRSRQFEDPGVRGVVDRQPMGQELIDVRHEAQGLADAALTFLLHISERRAIGIANLVLVRQFDELRLLAHDEGVGSEQRGHPLSSRAPRFSPAADGFTLLSAGPHGTAKSPVRVAEQARSPMRPRAGRHKLTSVDGS